MSASTPVFGSAAADGEGFETRLAENAPHDLERARAEARAKYEQTDQLPGYSSVPGM